MSTTHLSAKDRKELKRPDAFMQQTGQVFRYISENARAIAALVAVIFAVVLGVVGYKMFQESKAEKGSSELYVAKQDFNATLAKTPKTDAGWEQKMQPAIEKMERVGKDYSGTAPAYEAYTALGELYFERGNFTKAIEQFQRAVKSAPSRALKMGAYYSLAFAQENAKQYDAAIDSLRQILNSGEKFLRGDTLMALGRNFELKGEKTKAAEQYALVSQEFPNSPLAKVAEIQKNQLR